MEISQREIQLVQKTWNLIRVIKPELVGDVFYSKLFDETPSLKKMFRSPMNVQYLKFVEMISMIVGRLHHLEEVTDEMREMAKRHEGYGVKPEHYQLVGNALLWTLQKGLGNDWNEEVHQAWAKCYRRLAEAMLASVEY